MPNVDTWLIIVGAVALYLISARHSKGNVHKGSTSSSDSHIPSNNKTEQRKASQSFKSNCDIGTIFENKVADLIRSDPILRSWDMFRNVTIYDTQGNKTEIDIILISSSGIFVIECKCWGGTLIANDDWNYWVQIDDSFKDCQLKYDMHSKKHLADNHIKALRSPILQNKQHVDTLKQYLNNGTDNAIKQFKQITVLSEKSNKDKLSISKFNEQKKTEYTNGISVQDYYTWIGTEDNICDVLKSYPVCATAVPVEEIYDTLSKHSRCCGQ